MKETLYGKSLSDLEVIAADAGLPAYGGRQLADWIYGKNAGGFESMSNIPARVRALLNERFTLEPYPPLKAVESADGTRKYLFAAGESGFVEAALIPEGDRATLCLSVQVGCRMGCAFCATGKQGLQGSLSTADILNQYRSLPERDRITNIVYMGMGEPLDNLSHVLASLEVFTASWGYDMSPTRITVSTVGLRSQMREYLEGCRCHLAVSLHSPFSEERRALVPAEKDYPLADMVRDLRRAHIFGQRRVSFEYIVFYGVNDSPRHSAELARLLHGMRCRVNLIAYHPVPGSRFETAPRATMERFEAELTAAGIQTTIRQSRGLDISAACGLLSTKELMKGRA
jgi:23S rRNA (adenine2503-C2)-methyltransferase